MVNIKLDRASLSTMTDFARQEMRDRPRQPEDTSDVHLAKCWMAAFLRVVSKEKKEAYLLTDNNVLEKIVLDF